MISNNIEQVLRQRIEMQDALITELYEQHDKRVRDLIVANNKLIDQRRAAMRLADDREKQIKLLLAMLGTDPEEPTS